MASQKTVLVGGATGRLGAVVPALLDRGHNVRALTRETGSPAAENLRELGAEVVYGDFDRPGGNVLGPSPRVEARVSTPSS